MTNKLTNRKALAIATNYISYNTVNQSQETIRFDGVDHSVDSVLEKLESMAAALDNKTANVKRKPTKTQMEDEALRASIMIFLLENPNLFVTCTDLGKKVSALNGLNNQKISALIKPLVEDGEVIKVTEKGKSLFQLAKSDGEEDFNPLLK